MKLELNNLAALVQGREMNLYQRSLAIAEFQSVIELLQKLENEVKANDTEQSDGNCNIPLVSESKLWYVEFKQKGSTHVMSTTSNTSSRDAIERDLLLRDYEVVNIRRIYFR